MGSIECDIKDCMQSRPDYIIALKQKKEKRQVTRKIAQEMRRRAESVESGEKISVWQHVSSVYRFLVSHKARRFGLAVWRKVR